jgi:hypothetical protein
MRREPLIVRLKKLMRIMCSDVESKNNRAIFSAVFMTAAKYPLFLLD